MIETTLICDNCEKQVSLKPHAQFSNINVMNDKSLQSWHIVKIDSQNVLLCSNCRKVWKKVEKEAIAKGKKEFFKK